MDETTLRDLAHRLRAELASVVPDRAERAAVEAALAAALARPDGDASAALLDALAARPATRAWLRERGATDDVRRVGPAGDSVVPSGLYYVCPENDDDLVLHEVPVAPPRCRAAHPQLEMQLVED